MSVVITLTSAAVVLGMTIGSSSLIAVADAISEHSLDTEKGIDTVFTDRELLQKTLEGFDCCLKKISESEYLMKTDSGNIRFVQKEPAQPFRIFFDDIKDVDGLLENMRSFEQDYGRNVQAYTYGHIKENLTDSMRIESQEVLDDDSLVLTICVE